jgi:hypothetical protein
MALTVKQRRMARGIWASEMEYATALAFIADPDSPPEAVAKLQTVIADQKVVMEGFAAKGGFSLADVEAWALRQTVMNEIRQLKAEVIAEKEVVIQAKEDFLRAYGVANPDDLTNDQVKWGIARTFKGMEMPAELEDLLLNWTAQKKDLRRDIAKLQALRDIAAELKLRLTPRWEA